MLIDNARIRDLWLFCAIGDPATAEIIRGQFNRHSIPGQDPNVIFAHFPGNMGEHNMTIVELNPEHGVGKWFNNGSFDFNGFFF